MCAFIDKQLNFVPIALSQDFTQLKMICVDIRSRYKHRFIAVYKPPHFDLQCTINNMMNCLESVCDVAYGVTICDDCNMPQVNWAYGYDLSCIPVLEACLCG